MDKILEFIDGKKTYIVAGLTCVGIILNSLGIVIPDFAWQLLAVAGLGAVRSALKKLEM